ncbi:hypothetical protein evm_004862, partial [Chilo suppressalis]
EEGRPIYYLDETWVNAGHTVSKTWEDTTVKSVKQDFLEGLSTGAKNSTSEGNRLIVVHIGNEKGFLPGSHRCKRCHRDGQRYLPLQIPRTIARHKLERTKHKEWLASKEILFDEKETKVELLAKVKAVKERGNSFYSIIDDFDLCILNDGSPTICPYPNRQASAVDIVLATSSIAHLCDWHVHSDPMGSYHYPTFLQLNIQPSLYEVPPVEEKYIYSKADWFKFYTMSETCFSELDIKNGFALELYNNFVNILNNLRDITIPKCKQNTTPNIRRKPAPWWNTKCAAAVKKSKEALKFYKSNPTIDNFIKYKKLDALKKKTIKEESRESWKNLCSSFDRLTPISRIWKYIKKFKRIAQDILLKIYNKLWQELIIPETWKTQCVIPVLKPNKPNKIASSYKPISLSSYLGKLFENMLKLRLGYFSESNNIIPPIQHGFRKFRSCSESFVSLIHDIKQVKLSHSNMICVFLDVKGAFDNVNIQELIQVLHDVGVPGKTLKWLYIFLSNRTVYVKFNNRLHGSRNANKGTMQGATLSPLLYNLYTSEILKYVNTDHVNILQFADDLLLYSINQNMNIAQNNINTALEQLHAYYCNKLKLQISPEKSSALVFSKYSNNLDISFDNNKIHIVNEHKFLGVIIDNQLKFDKHISHISAKALKGINILRYLAGTFWGSNPRIMNMLYKSIVRSHFDYSSLAYNNASSSLLKRLDVIQNIGLRLICGAMRSTSINSLEIETCIPPLFLRRLQLAERFCLKTLSSFNILSKKFESICNILQSSSAVNITAESLATAPKIIKIYTHVKNQSQNIHKSDIWPVYKCPFKGLINVNTDTVYLGNILNKNDFMQFKAIKSYTYFIYTDGSKNEYNVKAALYDPQDNYTLTIQLDSQCSIFTAECYAVYQALVFLNKKSFVNIVNLIIVTDSKSVLVALLNGLLCFKSNYILYNIVHLIEELGNKYINVEFCWVPSHSGIEGNEIVDSLTHIDPDENHSDILKVPFTDFKPFFRNNLYKLWKDYWNITLQSKGKWLAHIQKDIPNKPWHERFKYRSRKFITVISRMRLVHCLTPTHMHRIKIFSSAQCLHCREENADLDHIIMTCPKFNLQRLLLVSEVSDICERNKICIPRRVQELLSNSDFYLPLFNFIEDTVDKI